MPGVPPLTLRSVSRKSWYSSWQGTSLALSLLQPAAFLGIARPKVERLKPYQPFVVAKPVNAGAPPVVVFFRPEYHHRLILSGLAWYQSCLITTASPRHPLSSPQMKAFLVLKEGFGLKACMWWWYSVPAPRSLGGDNLIGLETHSLCLESRQNEWSCGRVCMGGEVGYLDSYLDLKLHLGVV